jgi:hypothetical protein
VGVEPRTQRARLEIRRILAADAHSPLSPLSLAWFLDEYGGPAEQDAWERAVGTCRAEVMELTAAFTNADPALGSEPVARALWGCARSPALARKLRRNVSDLLDILPARQAQDGTWIGEGGAVDFRSTAFAAVALQRLGDDRQRSATRVAAISLFRSQTEDGGFPRRPDEIGEPLTTALALEAIRRSGLAVELEEIKLAEAWLLIEQEASGAWQSPDAAEGEVTTIVLNYFSRRSAFLPQVDGFFLMARDFFRKADELALDGGANDRRLATIAAVHAMEMFLYGLFERRPDLGLSAYRDNGVETIGPREALRTLQESLYQAGLLVQPRRLAFRDQVMSLISRRDGIIHRAHEISAEELQIGLKHVRAFIDHYGAQLATLDLLQ